MTSAKDERRPSENRLFRISGYTFGLITLLLPLVGFISSVVISILFNFEESTATHCKVKNYLPSISSSIGGFTPQRYIWRICIALHSTPRLIVGCFFLNYYLSLTVPSGQGLYRALVFTTFTLYNLENIALILLTNVSSVENYFVHENSFVAFMVFSLCHMLATCILMKWGHKHTGMPDRIALGFKWKKRFFCANALSFLCAVHFFFRHNTYCEPGVYTIFALLEYIIVTSNIGFHGCFVLEFGSTQLIAQPDDGEGRYHLV